MNKAMRNFKMRPLLVAAFFIAGGGILFATNWKLSAPVRPNDLEWL